MDGDVSLLPAKWAKMWKLTSGDTDGRLCLDNGLISVGVHDGARNSAILLWSPKPGYSALLDLAQYDDNCYSHYPGTRCISAGFRKSEK